MSGQISDESVPPESHHPIKMIVKYKIAIRIIKFLSDHNLPITSTLLLKSIRILNKELFI